VELRPALNSTGNRYNGTVDGATGQFIIRNVLPGLYNLATFISNMDAATSVDVRSSDVENVNLTLTPGFPLPTRVTMDGVAPGTPLPNGLTMLIRQQSLRLRVRRRISRSIRKAHFSIPNVGEDDTRVYVLPDAEHTGMAALNIPDQLAGRLCEIGETRRGRMLNTAFILPAEPDKVLEIVLGKERRFARRPSRRRKQTAGGRRFVILSADMPARGCIAPTCIKHLHRRGGPFRNQNPAARRIQGVCDWRVSKRMRGSIRTSSNL
jgi:hypothetical protein